MNYSEQKEYYYSLIDFIDRKIAESEEMCNTDNLLNAPNIQAHASYWGGVRDVMIELRELVRPEVKSDEN